MDIEVVQGDITHMQVDAIVNAANSGLRGGGGVDGAIHRAGGPSIMEECRVIGHCPTGQAVVTTAGDLPSGKVIHTVGPVWQGGDHGEPGLLEACYLSSLKIALHLDLHSIAFPNISTGVYGFPKEHAAEIAVAAVRDFLKANTGWDIRVVFVCYDTENYDLYKALLSQ